MSHRNLRIAHWIASAVLIGGFVLIMPSSFASDLNRQLSVQSNPRSQTKLRAEADRWLQQGIENRQLGKIAQAIEAWQQALDLYHQVGEDGSKGRIYDLLGMTYINLGQIDEAEGAFRRGLAIARDQEDFVKQIYGFNNVGQVLLQRGQLAEAQRSFEQGLKLAQEVKHSGGQGLSFSNLGLVAYRLGQPRTAIHFLEQARDLRSQADDPVGVANTLNTLGEAYQAIGDYRSAYVSHRQAMFLGKNSADRPTQYRAMDGLIAAYQGLGQENYFADALNQRLAMATEYNDPQEVLNSLKLMAQVQRRKGNLTAAEGYYQQAYDVARSINATQEEEFLVAQLGTLRSRKYMK
jgi:tetratricopeptide (TPR) repeat protein